MSNKKKNFDGLNINSNEKNDIMGYANKKAEKGEKSVRSLFEKGTNKEQNELNENSFGKMKKSKNSFNQ